MLHIHLHNRLLARQSMNAALRLLYRGGAWLAAADSASIAFFGLEHLRAYKKLAQLSIDAREPRFPIHCKAHMLNHTFRFLELWAQQVEWVENPLADSCQIDESFVGAISRFSRRVSPRMTILRTYDLYVTALRDRVHQGHDDASELE